MPRKLEKAVSIADEDARPVFERAWKNTTDQEDSPEYRILIWGSTVEDRRDPVDLDLIFEYTGDSINPDKENSIEGWIKNSVNVKSFSYIDPLVVSYLELPSIISKSRVSSVYSVDEEGWVHFDD